jgi:hypothetical protein
LAWLIEIAQKCNIDCTSQTKPNVKEHIHSLLKNIEGFVRVLYPTYMHFVCIHVLEKSKDYSNEDLQGLVGCFREVRECN